MSKREDLAKILLSYVGDIADHPRDFKAIAGYVLEFYVPKTALKPLKEVKRFKDNCPDYADYRKLANLAYEAIEETLSLCGDEK